MAALDTEAQLILTYSVYPRIDGRFITALSFGRIVVQKCSHFLCYPSAHPERQTLVAQQNTQSSVLTFQRSRTPFCVLTSNQSLLFKPSLPPTSHATTNHQSHQCLPLPLDPKSRNIPQSGSDSLVSLHLARVHPAPQYRRPGDPSTPGPKEARRR
jgi:hypothetical protein